MLIYKTMEEHKNFTVTLHLSHFFQDHRSTCKIFISSEMKYVVDLQDHIQKIFQIKNFYFISNGCYIPATEDIRVFQPNDVIIAVPTQTINRVITTVSTSTPMTRDVDFSSSKGKRRREIVIEEDMDTGSSNKDVEVKSKRKKKKKFAVDISVPDVDENLKLENLVTPILHKETKGCKSLVYDKQEEHQPMEHEEIKTNSENDTAKSKRKSRKSAPSKQEENLLNNSVKEKVEYFEIHSNTNKSKNENEINSKTNETEEHHRSEANLDKNDSDPANRDVGNDDDSEIFKQKKLFVHKRNNNLINFDLPKKSNIVKSILISNKPWEQGNSSLNPLNGQDNESHDIILNPDINISRKKINESCNINRNITQYSPKELTKGKMSFSTSNNNLVVSSSEDLELKHKLDDENSKNMYVYECKETNTSSRSEIIPKEGTITTSNSHQLNSIENIPSNISNLSNKDVECINSSVTDNVNNAEQSLEHSFFKLSSQSDSLLESTRDTEADQNVFHNIAEESGFVTRRRRKRSHRKRKSKTNAESEVVLIQTSMEPYPKTSEFYSKMSWGSASPTIHIKFDDDDEPVPSTKNDVEEKNPNLVENAKIISEEMVSRKEKIPIENNEATSEETISLRNENINADTDLVNGTDDASNAESIKTNKSSKNAPSELKNYSMDSTRICDETAEEISKLFASAPCLISEDTILKSPSMTATKPRSKDIIAFKILRLTTNYTPEVSKYIIGEVQSVNDDCSNIDINIIDGAEECKEPDGKFCLEDSNEKLENVNCVKSFSWSSLIDPRLIFP